MKTLRYTAVIGFLVLAGCSGSAEVRATNSLAIACDTFATILDQLTPLRKANKISPDNVERVNSTVRTVNRACSRAATLDPEDAIDIVDRGIAMIRLVKSAVGG